MLDIRDLEINHGFSVQSAIYYDGINHHYRITKDPRLNCFELVVETLDYEEEWTTRQRYNCSKLSTAIATIEDLEDGKEICSWKN